MTSKPLSHPVITPSQLPPGATVIDMGKAPGAAEPYRLVWLRGPNGHQQLYRLVPELPEVGPEEAKPQP